MLVYTWMIAWIAVFLLHLFYQVEGGVVGLKKEFKAMYPSAWLKKGFKSEQLMHQTIDHLCIDMNDVFHNVFRGSKTEAIGFMRLYKTLDHIIDQVKPTTSIVFACDGPAPFAKLLLQYSRRRDASSHGTIGLTAGSKLMDLMETSLITYLIQRDRRPYFQANSKGLTFFISCPNYPGEGEHKIIQWINQHKPAKVALATSTTTKQLKTENIVIYGGDADLILQAFTLVNDDYELAEQSLMAAKRQVYLMFQDNSGPSAATRAARSSSASSASSSASSSSHMPVFLLLSVNIIKALATSRKPPLPIAAVSASTSTQPQPSQQQLANKSTQPIANKSTLFLDILKETSSAASAADTNSNLPVTATAIADTLPTSQQHHRWSTGDLVFLHLLLGNDYLPKLRGITYKRAVTSYSHSLQLTLAAYAAAGSADQQQQQQQKDRAGSSIMRLKQQQGHDQHQPQLTQYEYQWLPLYLFMKQLRHYDGNTVHLHRRPAVSSSDLTDDTDDKSNEIDDNEDESDNHQLPTADVAAISASNSGSQSAAEAVEDIDTISLLQSIPGPSILSRFDQYIRMKKRYTASQWTATATSSAWFGDQAQLANVDPRSVLLTFTLEESLPQQQSDQLLQHRLRYTFTLYANRLIKPTMQMEQIEVRPDGSLQIVANNSSSLGHQLSATSSAAESASMSANNVAYYSSFKDAKKAFCHSIFAYLDPIEYSQFRVRCQAWKDVIHEEINLAWQKKQHHKQQQVKLPQATASPRQQLIAGNTTTADGRHQQLVTTIRNQIFHHLRSQRKAAKRPSSQDITAYLYGLRWILELYSTGLCPDYAYSYDPQRPLVTTQDIVQYLEEMVKEQHRKQLLLASGGVQGEQETKKRQRKSSSEHSLSAGNEDDPLLQMYFALTAAQQAEAEAEASSMSSSIDQLLNQAIDQYSTSSASSSSASNGSSGRRRSTALPLHPRMNCACLLPPWARASIPPEILPAWEKIQGSIFQPLMKEIDGLAPPKETEDDEEDEVDDIADEEEKQLMIVNDEGGDEGRREGQLLLTYEQLIKRLLAIVEETSSATATQPLSRVEAIKKVVLVPRHTWLAISKSSLPSTAVATEVAASAGSNSYSGNGMDDRFRGDYEYDTLLYANAVASVAVTAAGSSDEQSASIHASDSSVSGSSRGSSGLIIPVSSLPTGFKPCYVPKWYRFHRLLSHAVISSSSNPSPSITASDPAPAKNRASRSKSVKNPAGKLTPVEVTLVKEETSNKNKNSSTS